MKKIVRIGAGSAWWGDRIEPARWNAERGDLDRAEVAKAIAELGVNADSPAPWTV